MTPSPAPRGELTPEIRKALDAYENAAYVCGEQREHSADPTNLTGLSRGYLDLRARKIDARAALESAILALSGPPSGQESEEWCPRCDGCGWYEGGKTLQTKCERCGGTGKVSGEAVCSFCKESGHYGFECKKLAATDVWQESRAGGAAPQEPDFQKAKEALEHFLRETVLLDVDHKRLVRATLDQAEKKVRDADRVMAAIDKAVVSGALDSRSLIADARLAYGTPFSQEAIR